MTFDDELREALSSYDPPRRTDFDLSRATALAERSPLPADDAGTRVVDDAPIGDHLARRSTRNKVAVGAVVLAVAAAVGIVFVVRRSNANPTSVAAALGLHGAQSAKSTSGMDPHEAVARSEATKLLEAFVPPKGASRTSNSAPLDAPALSSSSTNAVVVTRIWRLPGNATGLDAELSAKPPKGMHVIGRGSSSVDATDPSGETQHLYLSLAPADAEISGFTAVLARGVKGSLQLSMADVGGGRVVLRADAVTIWTRTRTLAEQVPSGTYRMIIAHDRGMNASNTVSHVTISDEATIGQVAAMLDGLEPGSSRSVFCPMSDDEHFVLSFTARPGGPTVATARVNANGCRDATITISGKTNTYYPGSDELIALLKRLDP
jgi:hypothetical protein